MSTQEETVLVVDDDDAVRRSLKFALELEGLKVRLYRGGAQLLGAGDIPAAGCLVVDYNMPEMNGVELIARLRRRAIDLPAILIAAKLTDAIRDKATKAGFRHALEKPLADNSLIDSIRAALAAGPAADLRGIP